MVRGSLMAIRWKPMLMQLLSRWIAGIVAALLLMMDRYGEQFARLAEDAEASPWPVWFDES